MIYKLLLRAFPQHIKPDSVYAHFPLVVPSKNREIFAKLGWEQRYTYDRPAFISPPTLITSYEACKSVLDNQKDFKVTWGKTIKFLMHNSGKEYGADFMLSGDQPVHLKSREIMTPALYCGGWDQEVRSFYERVTLELLHEKSYKIAGANQVDIVRDVGNLANVHFAAEVFSFPLKTNQRALGVYTESELYQVMACKWTRHGLTCKTNFMCPAYFPQWSSYVFSSMSIRRKVSNSTKLLEVLHSNLVKYFSESLTW